MAIEGTVERLNADGLGVVQAERREILVPFSLPGERVRVEKTRRKKKKRIADEFEFIELSPTRKKPECPYFGRCGGCLLQHMHYMDQLEFKRVKLKNILGEDVEIIPSPKIFGHRNRIDIVISTRGVGFRRYGTWWDVVDIEECRVFGPSSRRVLTSLREFIKDHELSLYEIGKNEGFLRYIVIREGKFTGELMVNLVTGPGRLPEDFPEYFDYADSVYWSVNRTKSDVSYGEIQAFWRSGFIREELGGTVYLIHPNSFFQTNSYQAVNLLTRVADNVDGEKILDLYSGVGTFGVYLAKRGFNVEGIEINPFAVEMAKKNAELNGVNAEFHVGEDRDVKKLEVYDTVIVDPPRAGLHPKLVKGFVQRGPDTIIYVSCNPKTLARNLSDLKESYTVSDITGLDMFPHTPHVEVVVKLKRQKFH